MIDAKDKAALEAGLDPTDGRKQRVIAILESMPQVINITSVFRDGGHTEHSDRKHFDCQPVSEGQTIRTYSAQLLLAAAMQQRGIRAEVHRNRSNKNWHVHATLIDFSRSATQDEVIIKDLDQSGKYRRTGVYSVSTRLVEDPSTAFAPKRSVRAGLASAVKADPVVEANTLPGVANPDAPSESSEPFKLSDLAEITNPYDRAAYLKILDGSWTKIDDFREPSTDADVSALIAARAISLAVPALTSVTARIALWKFAIVSEPARRVAVLVKNVIDYSSRSSSPDPSVAAKLMPRDDSAPTGSTRWAPRESENVVVTGNATNWTGVIPLPTAYFSILEATGLVRYARFYIQPPIALRTRSLGVGSAFTALWFIDDDGWDGSIDAGDHNYTEVEYQTMKAASSGRKNSRVSDTATWTFVTSGSHLLRPSQDRGFEWDECMLAGSSPSAYWIFSLALAGALGEDQFSRASREQAGFKVPPEMSIAASATVMREFRRSLVGKRDRYNVNPQAPLSVIQALPLTFEQRSEIQKVREIDRKRRIQEGETKMTEASSKGDRS